MRDMQARIAITSCLLLISVSTVIGQSVPDTPENRRKEAERYLHTMSPRDLFRDAVEKAATHVPLAQREQFKQELAAHFDFDALANAMRAAMAEHFTAEELKALADLYSSPVGKSAKNKFGAYMAAVTMAMQAGISKAQAKTNDAASFSEQPKLETNKAIVRKVFDEILSKGNYAAANEIYAKDFVNHTATKDVSLEQDQASARGWREAFPDLQMKIEKEIAEGEYVTVLWTGHGTNTGSGNGLTATGKRADGRGVSIFRVVDGKIKEEWTEYDQLTLMRQLGLLSSAQK